MFPNEAKPYQEEKKTKAQPLSFSSLPDEIVENILARTPMWNYPNISHVSKRFLSILSSPEIYVTRSWIGTTEPCLYFCLDDLPYIPTPTWFILSMKSADETLTGDDDILKDYSLVPVPSCPHPHDVPSSCTVSVGSEIYLIGGPSNGPPSSLVRILDCLSHTWRDGPSMSVARSGANAFFIRGKIYVLERGRKDDNWMEALDIETQTWSPLLSHGATEFRSDWFIIKKFGRKIYAIANKNYAYDPKEGTWKVVETYDTFKHIDVASCVVDNVMYSYTIAGYLIWYDYIRGIWKNVKGSDLELLRTNKTYSIANGRVLNISNHDGKLVVMWVPMFKEYDGELESRIWCAKIALEPYGDDVWGKIEWANEVLKVTNSYNFLSCVVCWI